MGDAGSLEKIEAEQEANGNPFPKHSHRFAPENLWPENRTDDSL